MIPFTVPRIDQKIIDEVVAVLKSGWLTTGPRTKLFEEKLAAYTGAGKVLCLNSATAGLELILRWYGVKEGDEVILPAYTYTATANVIMHCGAKPVFVDVNKDDFNIAVAEIGKAITTRTRVIMPVDFAGFPCDYASIHRLVEDPAVRKKFRPSTPEQEMLGRILVLSDAAHSIGASRGGKKTGSLTDISVFSFHAVKNLTTGEGGAVALNLPQPFDNGAIYRYLCIKSLHGQNKDALAKSQTGNWKYDVIEPGYKWNMTDMAAAMGLVELERYDRENIKRRKEIVEKYNSLFKEKKWAQTPVFSDKDKEIESSCHLYPLRIRGVSESQRDLVMKEIFSRDVSVNVHFTPVPMLSFYVNSGYSIHDYPNALDNYSREISLPLYYGMTEEQVETVVRAVSDSVDAVLGH